MTDKTDKAGALKRGRGRPPKYATAKEREEARKAYYREWYAKNRSKRLAAAKAYNQRPAVRARVNQRAKDVRRLRLSDTAEERLEAMAPASGRNPHGPGRKPKAIKRNGVRLVVYSLSRFARFVGRSEATILHWHQAGVLPGVTWQSAGGGGISYYSKEYMIAVVEGLQSAAKVIARPTESDFRKHIRAVFAAKKIITRTRCPRIRKTK